MIDRMYFVVYQYSNIKFDYCGIEVSVFYGA